MSLFRLVSGPWDHHARFLIVFGPWHHHATVTFKFLDHDITMPLLLLSFQTMTSPCHCYFSDHGITCHFYFKIFVGRWPGSSQSCYLVRRRWASHHPASQVRAPYLFLFQMVDPDSEARSGSRGHIRIRREKNYKHIVCSTFLKCLQLKGRK
jgi:hypothetical protein